jgi:hypothetical protein
MPDNVSSNSPPIKTRSHDGMIPSSEVFGSGSEQSLWSGLHTNNAFENTQKDWIAISLLQVLLIWCNVILM